MAEGGGQQKGAGHRGGQIGNFPAFSVGESSLCCGGASSAREGGETFPRPRILPARGRDWDVSPMTA